MSNKNAAFIKDFGFEVYEDLFEALYSKLFNNRMDERFDFVSVHDRGHQNYIFDVYYMHKGIVCYINGEEGNWDGSIIIDYEIESESNEERLEEMLKISSEDFWCIAG